MAAFCLFRDKCEYSNDVVEAVQAMMSLRPEWTDMRFS